MYAIKVRRGYAEAINTLLDGETVEGLSMLRDLVCAENKGCRAVGKRP